MKKVLTILTPLFLMFALTSCLGDLLAVGGLINFNIDVPAPNVAIKSGTSGTVQVNITVGNTGSPANIDFTLLNPPAGFTADKAQSASINTSKTINITVANTVAASNTPVQLTLNATNGVLTHTAVLNVTVTP